MRPRLGDVPWRGTGALVLVVMLSVAAALLPSAYGLACVLVAAALAIRVLVRLGSSRGLNDYRQ